MNGFSTEQYSGSSQFVLIESSSVNPLMRPRLWIRIASLAALLAAAWLLLIPRTALYSVDDEGRPQDVRAKWSWSYSGRDGNVTMIHPSDLVDTGEPVKLTTSVRLGCGTAFTSGEYEGEEPHGKAACSQMETPRRIIGLPLAALGVIGFLVAPRFPISRDPEEAWLYESYDDHRKPDTDS